MIALVDSGDDIKVKTWRAGCIFLAQKTIISDAKLLRATVATVAALNLGYDCLTKKFR